MTTIGAPVTRETSPFPNLFGGQASRIAALIRIAPDLAARLALAPARALHAVSAFLEAEAARGVPLERMADALASSDPRDLLACAMPGHHARLFRLLDRVTLPAWSLADLRALNEVLHAEIADALGSGPITVDVMRSARAILDAHPVLRRLAGTVTTTWMREQVAVVLAWLAEHDALEALAATPTGAGLQAVARRLRRGLALLRAPLPPFPIPSGWTHVDTAEALWSAGRNLKNCLTLGAYGSGERIEAILTGREVYLLDASREAVVRLRHVGGRAWCLIETGARENTEMQAADERELTDALRDAGVVLLLDDLGTALDHVLRPLRGKPDLADAEDDDPQNGDQQAAA